VKVVEVAEVEPCTVHLNQGLPLPTLLIPMHASNTRRVIPAPIHLVLKLFRDCSPPKIINPVVRAVPIDVVNRRFAIWIRNEAMRDKARPAHGVVPPVFIKRCTVVPATGYSPLLHASRGYVRHVVGVLGIHVVLLKTRNQHVRIMTHCVLPKVLHKKVKKSFEQKFIYRILQSSRKFSKKVFYWSDFSYKSFS
jgi:hypothetical protein